MGWELFIIKSIAFLVGAYFFWLALLMYDYEKDKAFKKAMRNSKKIRRNLENNKYSYQRLKEHYFSSLKLILEKLFFSGSLYTTLGVMITLILIPYLFYRLYWVTFVVVGWSPLAYIGHYILRGGLIVFLGYFLIALYSNDNQKKEKAIRALNTVGLAFTIGFFISAIFSVIVYFTNESYDSKHGVALVFQYFSCSVVTVLMMGNLFGYYKYVVRSQSLFKSITYSLLNLLIIMLLLSYVYGINVNFLIVIFGQEEGILNTEILNLFEQIFSLTFLPFLISLLFIIMHIFILCARPFANLIARSLYSFSANEFLKQKKILLVLSGLFISIAFPIVKKILNLVEIGI